MFEWEQKAQTLAAMYWDRGAQELTRDSTCYHNFITEQFALVIDRKFSVT